MWRAGIETGANHERPAEDLRHHAARRRAVAGHLPRRGREARDRRAAGPSRGRHHRSRVPHRQHRRLRGRGSRRPGRPRPGDHGAVPHRLPGRGPGVGGGAARRAAPRPRVHRHVADPHGEEAAHDRGAGESRGGRGGRPGPLVLRRCRVLPRGRQPLRRGVHVRGAPGRRRPGGHDAQHPRHRRIRRPRGVRASHRPRPGDGARRLRRVHPLPQRLGARRRQLPRGGEGRGPPGRVRDQRSRGAGRQRGVGGDRHGGPDPP